MSRKDHSEEWAERLFDELTNEWQHGDELCAATGLSLYQLGKAVRVLRNSFPDDPLISCPKWGYRWSDERADVDRFDRWQARNAKTRLKTSLRGALVPYMVKMGVSQREIEAAKRSLDRLVEDIDLYYDAAETAA